MSKAKLIILTLVLLIVPITYAYDTYDFFTKCIRHNDRLVKVVNYEPYEVDWGNGTISTEYAPYTSYEWQRLCLSETQVIKHNNKYIPMKPLNLFCAVQGNWVVCDSIYDGNGNGVCTPGESCVAMNLNNGNILYQDYYSDNYKQYMVRR